NMPTVITSVSPAQRLSRAFNHVGQNSMKITASGGSVLRGHQQANPGQNSSGYEVAHADGWAEYQKVMPLLLGGDQLVNNAPRTAKAAMERAMRQTCPNVSSTLLENFFNGNEPVEQYADGIEETFTGKVAMTKTDNGWQEDR
ncbi:hypothetical protein LGM66_31455, partial [Burkholderia vietnamiensis]|nr:hypothetical protein [Burkholderia vietnamiensis]